MHCKSYYQIFFYRLFRIHLRTQRISLSQNQKPFSLTLLSAQKPHHQDLTDPLRRQTQEKGQEILQNPKWILYPLQTQLFLQRNLHYQSLHHQCHQRLQSKCRQKLIQTCHLLKLLCVGWMTSRMESKLQCIVGRKSLMGDF